MNALSSGERLRQLRSLTDMTIDKIAFQLGISIPAYRDLEDFNELDYNLSLNDIGYLAEMFKIASWQFFSAEAPLNVISPRNLHKALNDFIKINQMSIDYFEEEVGWKIEDFISEPEGAYANWNIDCLKDICGKIGLDWIGALPTREHPKPLNLGRQS